MSLQLYRENSAYRQQQRSNSEWTKKITALSQIYLCFWSRWTSCVWPSWLQLCFVCAANTELSASKPTEKHTHEAHHQHLKACKPHWIIAKDKNLPACPFRALPSKPLPIFYSVRQTLQITYANTYSLYVFFLLLGLKCFITNYTVFQSFSHLVPAVLHLCWPCTPYRTPDTLLCFSSWAWWQKKTNNNWAYH